MDESEDNLSADDAKMGHTPISSKCKPKKRSLVERELETNLTARVTSPVTNSEACNTSRYGRALRLKTESDFIDTEKILGKATKSPVEKTPVKIQSSPVYKMHASNSPIKGENSRIPIEVKGIEINLENQIDNIYNENMSLSRFGSSEKKKLSPVKLPKVYVRKDLIQKKEKEETVTLIKNMFSPRSGQKCSNSHLRNILERSSEKYNLDSSEKKITTSNGFVNTSSVVKTLDFDNNKKKKDNINKIIISKSDLFELEAKCEYQVGDLAWARMGTYPFWPCIVTREPVTGMFVRKKLFGRVERDIINVTFFGDNGRRSWIVDTMLRKFLGQLEFETTREHFCPTVKKRDPRLYAAFFVSDKKMPQWSISVEEAETLLREPKRLRIDIFNDMLVKSRNMKAVKQKSGKVTRTSSDVSLSESLYDTLFSENDGKSEESDGSRSKTRKSLDVSEVVTACLDNMAAKTGMTKIRKQSHMDRWLQKAKSKTPEKSQVKLQVLTKEKEKVISSKKKKWDTPKKMPFNKPYSLRKSHESQNLMSHHNEHDYGSRDDSDVIPGITFGIITKVESLQNKEDDKLYDTPSKIDLDETNIIMCKSPTFTQDYDNLIFAYEGEKNSTSLDISENSGCAESHLEKNDILTIENIKNPEDTAKERKENEHSTLSSPIPEEKSNVEKSNESDNGETVQVSTYSHMNGHLKDNINTDSEVDSKNNENISNNEFNKADGVDLKMDISSPNSSKANECSFSRQINYISTSQCNGYNDSGVSSKCDLSLQSIEKTDTDSSVDSSSQSLEYYESNFPHFVKPRAQSRIVKKRSLRLKNRTKPKTTKSNATISQDDGFAKYVDLRKDALMDENPELSQNEIMDYLLKTWQYEKGDVSDVNQSNVSSNENKVPEKECVQNDTSKIKSSSDLNATKKICKVSLTDILLQNNISVAFKNGQKTCVLPGIGLKLTDILETCKLTHGSESDKEISSMPASSINENNICNVNDEKTCFNKLESSFNLSVEDEIHDDSNENTVIHKSNSELSLNIFPDNENCCYNDKTMNNLNSELLLKNSSHCEIQKLDNESIEIVTHNPKISTNKNEIVSFNKIQFEKENNGIETINHQNLQDDIINQNKVSNESRILSDLEKNDGTVDSTVCKPYEPNAIKENFILEKESRSISERTLNDLPDESETVLTSNTSKHLNENEEDDALLKSIDDFVNDENSATKSFDEVNNDECIQTGDEKGVSTNEDFEAVIDTTTEIVSLEPSWTFSPQNITNGNVNEKVQASKEAFSDKLVTYKNTTATGDDLNITKDKCISTTSEELTIPNDIGLSGKELHILTNKKECVTDAEFTIAKDKDSATEIILTNKLETREAITIVDVEQSIAEDQPNDNEEISDENVPQLVKINGFQSSTDCTPDISDGEFNAETSSINSEDSEPLSMVKTKLQFKYHQKTKRDLNNPDFVKYIELHQDALIDEHPELTREEIIDYMYKTWLYDENTKSDFMKTDNIEQSGLVKGLNDSLRQKSMRNSFRLNKKRKAKSSEDSLSINSDSSDTSIQRKLRERLVKSPFIAHEINQMKESSPDRKLEDERDECHSTNSNVSDKLTSLKLENKTLNNSIDEGINFQNQSTNSALLLENQTEVTNNKLSQDEEKSSTEKTSPQTKSSKDCETKKYFDIFNQNKHKNNVLKIECEMKVKEEYDPDTVSINSEDSDISLSKRKQRKYLDKQPNKEDPEFLKYLELRQDALIDENPELTQDEIVSYLYKTWLYEESVKSDIKKSDEIEQASLVKGLNSDPQQPKKARKRVKVEKELVVNEDLAQKDKPKRKSSHPYYIEDDLSDSEDVEVFDIFISKQQHQTNEVIDIDDFVDEVDFYFSELTRPKPNVFKGLVREKVCEICERTSNLVKCKGCNCMYHEDCVKKETEVKVELPPPPRGRKKKKKVYRKLKNLDESESHSDDKSQDFSEENNVSIDDVTELESYTVDAESFESVLEVKMKELISTEANYDTCFSDCGITWNGTIAGKCEIVDVKLQPKLEPDYSDFKCNSCQKYDIPVCFVCKLATSKTGIEYRQRCQTAHCYKYYHMECLDHWPQTQFHTSKIGNRSSDRFEEFMCPRHVCHTCVSDDPRGCKTRFSGDKLARCVRCPATYHTFTKCLPAGSQILTASHIVCPRHYEHRPGKVPCHVNTGWCFICALGGSLICCEYCPTSFHAECLNINPPEGGYMCEDCETGRLPLYGEMVWVKLGHYRWWPGLILHPSQIPDNIMAVKHSPGEFVVRFFGQYDHYWVNRGRVFPFQEGDSGRISSQKSKIDAAFTTAVEHAKRACEILKRAQINEVEETDIASSLLPPHYVKLKVNKPVGSVCSRRADVEEGSLTQCDCNPDVEDPCGPYSNCLNRMLLTECGPSCRAGDRCNNRAFEKRLYPRMAPYRTPHRGWGLRALQDIKAGQFVIEYVGELIDEEEFRRRMNRKHEIRDENFYFLTLDKERMIDAGPKGNLARFMNHCCEPNCETQKWTVLGDVRVGLFAINDIPANSELTFNYNLECAGIEKKRCLCGAKRCSGYMGAKPKQDEQPKKPKRTYKKRKPAEDSPSASKNKPKRPVGRPAKPKELTEIEKDLLIIKTATNGLSSDSECSLRLSSIETDKNTKALKRKRVNFSTEEGHSSPTTKKPKLDEEKSIEVGD